MFLIILINHLKLIYSKLNVFWRLEDFVFFCFIPNISMWLSMLKIDKFKEIFFYRKLLVSTKFRGKSNPISFERNLRDKI